MQKPYLVTPKGNEIHFFLPTDNPVLPPDDNHVPMTFTQVIAHYRDDIVFIYELDRQQWELPGGNIEPNEHPDDCAKRELFEESGQVAAHVVCRGIFRAYFTYNHEVEYGVVYEAWIDNLLPFTPNDECSHMVLKRPPYQFEGIFSPFSQAMLEFISQFHD